MIETRILQQQNEMLRGFLNAERAFWNHLLFCPECQLQRLSSLLCPTSLILKHELRQHRATAVKKQNTKKQDGHKGKKSRAKKRTRAKK